MFEFLVHFLCILLGNYWRWWLRGIGGGEFDSQDGNTALILAAEQGHADCLRLLIDAGADKDAKDRVRVGRRFS